MPDETTNRPVAQTIHQANGWKEYQALVLAELKRLAEDMSGLRKDFHEFKLQNVKDTTTLYWRTGAISIVVGAVPATLVLLGLWIRTLLAGP